MHQVSWKRRWGPLQLSCVRKTDVCERAVEWLSASGQLDKMGLLQCNVTTGVCSRTLVHC